MREIEIRIKLDPSEFEQLQSWLKSNAQFTHESSHREFYFNNPSNSFLFKSIVGVDAKNYLRVRYSDKGGSICLKRFGLDESTGKTWNIDETEFNVSSADEAVLMLERLGYSEKFEIKKDRKAYEFENFEIVLDEVSSLGSFAEVEIKNFPEENDMKEAFKLIKNFLKEKIGFDKIKECKRGYLSMIWNPSEILWKEKEI